MGLRGASIAAVAVALLFACGEETESSSAIASGGAAGGHHHAGAAGMAAMGGTTSGGGSSATGGATGGGGQVGLDASNDATATDGDAQSLDVQNIVCSLGTMYPGVDVIDPDAPVFQDTNWTQQAVSDAFAQAKAQNSTAYQGYRAAHQYSQYLDCAWCACGCAASIGHLSAIDCFKDMHGFT